MRVNLYCHGVFVEDNGSRSVFMTSASDEDLLVKLKLEAPFEAFEVDEEPRQWFEYRIKFERIESRVHDHPE
jgi:hypothetical protein